MPPSCGAPRKDAADGPLSKATTASVFRELLEGDPPPAFVLTGDAAGLTEMLAESWSARLKHEAQSAEMTHLTPIDMERDTVVFDWRTPSFFAKYRLFILPDLADLKKGPREEIAEYLKGPTPQVTLFIPCSKKDPISTIKGVKSVSLRTDQAESAMSAFAASVIRDAGGKVTPQAAAFLARWIGLDFPRLKEEIRKLLATVEKGKEIGEDEIREICVAGGFEMDPFKFAEALIAGKMDQVIPMFRRFSKAAEKDEYFKLLGAVSWKVRASGGRMSPERAGALIDALGAIDRGIKGESELSPEQVVEIQLLKLLR